MTRRACKHRLTAPVHSIVVFERSPGDFVGNGVEKLICRRCFAWLPLGPSDESDPRVAVELDAAHVASQWNERQAEWLAIEALSDPGGRNVAVIDLARCIIDHDTEQRKG